MTEGVGGFVVGITALTALINRRTTLSAGSLYLGVYPIGMTSSLDGFGIALTTGTGISPYTGLSTGGLLSYLRGVGVLMFRRVSRIRRIGGIGGVGRIRRIGRLRRVGGVRGLSTLSRLSTFCGFSAFCRFSTLSSPNFLGGLSTISSPNLLGGLGALCGLRAFDNLALTAGGSTPGSNGSRLGSNPRLSPTGTPGTANAPNQERQNDTSGKNTHFFLSFHAFTSLSSYIKRGTAEAKNAQLPCATQDSTLPQNEDAKIEPAFLPEGKTQPRSGAKTFSCVAFLFYQSRNPFAIPPAEIYPVFGRIPR